MCLDVLGCAWGYLGVLLNWIDTSYQSIYCQSDIALDMTPEHLTPELDELNWGVL